MLAVVVLNALIGFAQEYRAGRAIAALAELVAERRRVRRDGAWIEVPAEHVVPGDLLDVAQGDRVAADLRLLEASSLRAEEAALTGESEPVDETRRRGPRGYAAGRAQRVFSLRAPSWPRAAAAASRWRRGLRTELGRISTLLGEVEPLRDAAHARPRPVRAHDHRRHRRCRRGARCRRRRCAGSRSPTPRWPASASQSPPCPRGCLRWSRSRLLWRSGAWPAGARSSATCRRSRRSERRPSSPPTRPGR